MRPNLQSSTRCIIAGKYLNLSISVEEIPTAPELLEIQEYNKIEYNRIKSKPGVCSLYHFLLVWVYRFHGGVPHLGKTPTHSQHITNTYFHFSKFCN